MPSRRTDSYLYWVPVEERVLIGAAIACLIAFHLLYGSLLSGPSVLMTAAWAAVLLGCLNIRETRNALNHASGLRIPALCYLIVIAVGLWTLTPWTPTGPLDAWRVVTASGAATLDRSATLLEVLKLLGLACAFLVGIALGGKDERAQRTITWLVVGGALFAIGSAIAFKSGLIRQTQGGRLEAFFLNPNTAGTVFGSLLPLSIGIFVSGLRRMRRGESRRMAILGGLCCLALAYALLLTLSRGAFAATALALLFLALTQLALKGRAPAVVLGGAGILALTTFYFVLVDDRLLMRMLAAPQDAGARAQIFATHWKAFLASPLTGYGLGSFDVLNKSLLTPETFKVLWDIRSAENLYLQWLVEGGLLAALPMFICIGALLLLTARRTLKRRRCRAWLHALLAADLVFLLHGLVDFGLQTPSVFAMFAFLLGLQVAFSAASSRTVPAVGETERPPLREGALIAATAAGSALLAGALGDGRVLGGVAHPYLGLAAGYDARADDLARLPDPARLEESRSLSLDALALSPKDTAAWLRLAYLDTRLKGTLSPEGVEALRRSYEAVAFDQYVAFWRVRFGLEHWSALPTDLRARVREEAFVVASNPGHRRPMLHLLKTIKEPRGSVVSHLWAATIESRRQRQRQLRDATL